MEEINNSDNLLEIILDLGRVPTARFVEHEIILRDSEVTRSEIDYVDERVGSFDADNRAGIERTLHRISAIRNRLSTIVGLTLRVGRAVYGTIDIIEDIISIWKIHPDPWPPRYWKNHIIARGGSNFGGK